MTDGTADAAGSCMERVNRLLTRHRRKLYLAWTAFLVVLAACEGGDNGGGY